MKKKIKNYGFTLVELLIVITLIAILAVAIVATLNPVEQVNRARDARYKNDASELLAAVERYYASTQEYPWQTVESATYTSNSVAYSALGEYAGVGICSGVDADAEGTCTTVAPGILITGDELKEQFVNKDQFATATLTDSDRLYVYKPASQSSVYVCFIPKANVNHTPTTQVKLWNLGMYGGAADSLPSTIASISDATAATWTDRTDSYLICVPE